MYTNYIYIIISKHLHFQFFNTRSKSLIDILLLLNYIDTFQKCINMNKFYVNFILIIYILIFIFILYYDPYEYFYINEEFTNTQIVKPQSKIGLITIMRKPIDLSLWLKYHRNLGITKFFFRVEDTPELEDYLKNQQDVWFEMSESDKIGNNYETLLQRHTIFIAKILKVSKEF